jgi:tetratricopeptide (TPR) repeat protein
MILWCAALNAQEHSDCRQKVVTGENLFKQGQYAQSEITLKQAIEGCNLGRKNRLDAYELLARVNIETDNIEDANRYLKQVIRLNPNYQPNPARVEEDFMKYFSKYRVTPVFTAGLYSELLMPKYVNVGAPNKILEGYDYKAPYESRKMNSIAGVIFSLGLPTNTRLSFGAGMMTLNYKRQINHSAIKNFYTVLNETDKYFNIPIEINQHFKIKRFTVYGGVGYALCILRSAAGTLIFNYPKLDYDTANYVDLINKKNLFFTEYSSADLKAQRQNFNLFKMNAGVTYNISSFIIDLKFSLNRALQRMNSNDLYLSQDIVFRNYYIDNNFYVKYPSVSFSVSYIIFHKISHRK